jgi:ribosomal protein L21
VPGINWNGIWFSRKTRALMETRKIWIADETNYLDDWQSGGAKRVAKTKTSVRGKQDKKIVVVKPHKKDDGTKVKGHRRSTPS